MGIGVLLTGDIGGEVDMGESDDDPHDDGGKNWDEVSDSGDRGVEEQVDTESFLDLDNPLLMLLLLLHWIVSLIGFISLFMICCCTRVKIQTDSEVSGWTWPSSEQRAVNSATDPLAAVIAVVMNMFVQHWARVILDLYFLLSGNISYQIQRVHLYKLST